MNKFNKLNYYLIASTFILSFTKGALELLGLPETILQLFIELLIFILFFHSLFFIVKRKKLKGPGLLVNFFLFTIILISYLLTNVNEVQMILFIRKFGIYYLFFYALFNLDISSIYKKQLVKLIMILFIIQVPAALVKMAIYGRGFEKIVGTMSVAEGSLATIMPLIAISYLITNYIYYKQNKYIIWTILFIVVGIASGKRAIIFYLVILFLYLVYMYARPKYFIPKAVFLRKLFPLLILISIFVPIFISLSPTLNPEHKVGGSIDIEHLKAYSTDYQTLDLGTGVEGDGRMDAPFVALDRMYNGGLINTLFGFGPGEIIKSSFMRYKDPLLEKYNIGYGGRIGLVWTLMQIGIIGTVFFILFHIILYKKMKNIYNKEKDEKMKILILSTLGMSLLYFIDYFTYSTLMIKSPGVTLTYFYAIFYVLSNADIYQNNKIRKFH